MPDITGTITHVAPRTVRVEEKPGQPAGDAKAVVRITAQTVIERNGQPVDETALQTGQQAKVWFYGPVAESYPVQAEAEGIAIQN
jgi:hypothetical protein